MRGKKKSIIKKFSNRNLKEHQKRSFLMIAIIGILTILITSLNIISENILKNMEDTYLMQYGNKSHIQLEGVLNNDMKSIADYSRIEKFGKSICVGDAVNEEFDGRPTQLRFGDINYAEFAFSYPRYGKMPKEENEIALDKSVLDDLNANAELGENVVLIWIGQDGIKKSQKFTITGLWEENDTCPNRMLWVSKSFADKAGGRVDMDITFKRKSNIEESYTAMSKKLNLTKIEKRVNWVYDSNTRFSMKKEILAYRIGTVFILICGFLVLYNIVLISAATDIKLYGRMMTIGVTPHQVIFALLRQIHILTVKGILVGLIFGYFLGSKLVPIVLTNSNSITYVKITDLAMAAFFVYLLSMAAAIKPSIIASKINPLDLLDEIGSYGYNKRSSRRPLGLPVLFQMSLYYIGGFKKRNIITIVLLTVGIVGMNCVYVINNSFDIEKYINEVTISDFTISEKTLVNPWGDYDSKGTTITKNVIEMVNNIEGLQKKGHLYSQNVLMQLSKAAYENIIAYYEQNNGEILEYMGTNSSWHKSYKKVKRTQECFVSIFGIDGIVTDKVFDSKVLEGKLDKEKFIKGQYAIANGIAGDSSLNKHQPTYNVGEKIYIDGKQFEIMAIAETPYSITEGKEKEDAAFNLKLFIPSSNFKEMYPQNTIRKMFFNVDSDYLANAEQFVEKNFESKSIPTVSQKRLLEDYYKETRAEILTRNMIVFMLLILGIVNFLNTIITSVRVREKEFAMMQGIGMTKKQLKILLVFEGLDIIAITLLFSYLFSIIAISTVVKVYLSTQWTAAYQFAITPLLIITPILVLASIIIPIACLWYMQREELMSRLHCDAEMKGIY